MGLIWNLIQHGQIKEAHERNASLETRVAQLEHEMERTNDTLIRLLRALERRFGDDLDGDGRIG
jgi:chaperonin cofactor prefoldin